MTSNIGISLDFYPNETQDYQYNRIISEVKSKFSPEVFNRFDEVLLFKPLDQSTLTQITLKHLEELINRLKEKNVELEIMNSAVTLVQENVSDSVLGARPLSRFIEQHLTGCLAQLLVEERVTDGCKVCCARLG
eukprot:GHVP01064638.1.p1 GENE.GHVP01064638.1~~GHVP01064638.1.p1  ORF type:complete len:134 (+),score=15.66 GHVP01064638.1:955-1356(+)